MALCPQCVNQVPDGHFCTQCGAELQYQALVHQLQAGTILTDGAFRSYAIGAVKGQGGFGITYIARDLRRNIRVAIKEYYPMQCAQREGICVAPQPGYEAVFAGGQSNFLKEAQMLASLPPLDSIVRIMDYFEVNGTAYIVMEYLDGMPLYQLVMRDGSIEPKALFSRLPRLMQDLKVLHDAEIIHRDISPDNIMWMPDGTLKLLDFGSARHLEDGKSVSIQLKHGFAPVEQYRTKGQGPYTDIYALCATVYYCLTGLVPPHPVERLEDDQLKTPSELGIRMEQSWEEGLLWGLTVQPKARPQETEVLLQRMFSGGIPAPECFPEKDDRNADNGHSTVRLDDTSEQNQTILPGPDPVKPKSASIPAAVKIAVAAAAVAVIVLVVLLLMLLSSKDSPAEELPAEPVQVWEPVEEPAEEPMEEMAEEPVEEPEEEPAETVSPWYGLQTPFGSIVDHVVTDEGVTLGITESEQYVLLAVPAGMEKLDLYEQFEAQMPIAYIFPGALDTDPDLSVLTLGGDTIMEWEDLNAYEGELYFYDGRLSGSWMHGLYLADYACLWGEGVLPDLALTMAAHEFVGEYYVSDMDENFWIDLLYETGIDYSTGAGVRMVSSDEQLVDRLCDKVEELYDQRFYSRMAVAYSWSETEGVEFLLICYNP